MHCMSVLNSCMQLKWITDIKVATLAFSSFTSFKTFPSVAVGLVKYGQILWSHHPGNAYLVDRNSSCEI